MPRLVNQITAARTPDSKRSGYTRQGAGVEVPKLKTGKAKVAGPTVGNNRGDTINNRLDNWQNQSIAANRGRNSVNEIIRRLCQEDGLFSSAAQSAVSIASSAGFKIAGYDGQGKMSFEVMEAAYSVIDMIDTFHNYAEGFNDKPSFRTLVATLILDTVSSGGCGGELVLGDGYMPERIAALPYSSVVWAANGKGGRYPTQKDNDANLNIPTISIAEHNRFPEEAYGYSMLRPGLQNTFTFTEFIEDMIRVLNRSGHARLVGTIDYAKSIASLPDEIRNDEEKLANVVGQMYNQLQQTLQGLEPEDALVAFDTTTFDQLESGNNKADYSSMLSALGNLVGSSLKTPASVTGLRAEGGEALSNAETLVYLKTISGVPVAACEVLSRLVTLAVRLWGVDGYVKFDPKPIDLRPENEVEAYLATRQKRILKLLSDGMISDSRACYELGLRPTDYGELLLSGTGFYEAERASEGGQGERETSSGRALNPGTPASTGGED